MRNVPSTIAMKVLFVASVAISLTACGDDDSPEPDYNLGYFDEEYYATSSDSVVTGPYSDVSYNSATLGGKLNIDIATLPSYYSYGIVYSTDSFPDPANDTRVTTKLKAQVYTCKVTGLKSGTKYFYRAYMKEKNGYKTGRVMNFVTPTCKVQTTEASEIGPFACTMGGKTNIDIKSSTFTGEVGVVYTSRQTDKPTYGVDSRAVGTANKLDSTAFDVFVNGLSQKTTYIFQAYLDLGDTIMFGDVRSFTTTELQISDEQEVDLGVGVLWSGWNAGATSAEAAGKYYGYGEPTGEIFTRSNANYPDILSIVNTEYDMAKAAFGDGWMLPTYEQWNTLLKDCEWHWLTYKGVQGYAVTGKNGKSIFLPAWESTVDGSEPTQSATPTAYFWTGNMPEENRTQGYCVKLNESMVKPTKGTSLKMDYRYKGMSVRGVK